MVVAYHKAFEGIALRQNPLEMSQRSSKPLAGFTRWEFRREREGGKGMGGRKEGMGGQEGEGEGTTHFCKQISAAD